MTATRATDAHGHCVDNPPRWGRRAPTAWYAYLNADGSCDFVTARWEDEGGKRFTQHRRKQDDPDGAWEAKAPEVRPLYNMVQIAEAFDDTNVLVVEGEKAWKSALQYLPPDWLVATWSGGASVVKKTDWSPLFRHRVVIWPDVDQQAFNSGPNDGEIKPWTMQPGMMAATAIAGIVNGAVVDISQGFIDAASWVVDSGWDLADPLPEGLLPRHVIAMMMKAVVHASPKASALAPAAVPPERPRDGVVEHVAPTAEPEHLNGHNVPTIDENFVLITNANGGIKPCFENARRTLVHHDWFKLRYDLFANRPMIGDHYIEDEHILLIAGKVQSAGVVASTTVIGEAIAAAALERRFHPVIDYLDSLQWDNVERLPEWLIDHAGAADNEYVREVSLRWLVQAIARVRDPGCKADAMLILEGPQGIRKSTLLRRLFGEKWFSDHLPDLSNKDSMVQLLGMWCIEVAELATLNRSENAKIKAFLSSPSDRFRPPYGRTAKDHPRSCVFAGTVNPAGGYLKDPTGARRFWPVLCGEIDSDAVGQLRDQLWAEADARYKRGEQWWLQERAEEAAKDEQDERREDDVWEERIQTFLELKTQTTVADVLDQAIGIHNAADWTPTDTQRVGRILSGVMKWHRVQRRERGEKPKWLYVKPSTLV